MSYQPFLIAAQETGIDHSVQPWLTPNDSYQALNDGYVYRGETKKRDGYSGFATGLPRMSTESRMIHTPAVLNPATGVIDGANKTFTFILTTPVSRGSVSIAGSNPVQAMADDGLGAFTGAGTGTINYSTGAVSITFTAAPIAMSTVHLTYSYYPGNPVMGVMNFYPADNDRRLIVADTRYVNKFDPNTNRLVDISPATAYHGGPKDFWSWVNYPPADTSPRLLFCNGNKDDVIQSYDGTTVTDYVYTSATITKLNARQMFDFKDRLVLFQTYETIAGPAQTFYPRRIRISGTGANCDVFDSSATGAGFIDIPDNTWFYGAATNRDDIIVFTEAATWILKYTGNEVVPFDLKRLDGSRGSKAAFSAFSYLNRTIAASPRGLIICDGYTVDRFDDKIPYFTFQTINSDEFESCYSGFIDEDRDVYLLYPSVNVERPALVDKGSSDEILTINFEEDNFATYRIPLSCVGNFVIDTNITWNDMLAYATWDEMAAVYGTWNDFPFIKAAPIMIGGGHKGEIWAMNNTESEDNPQNIRAITVLDLWTVRVTTDWNNYEKGDYISFDGIVGMTQLNNKQGTIENIQTNYTTFDVKLGIETTGFGSYTSGGVASKNVPFEAFTKKFNPYVLQGMDKKIRCGWCYFYIDTATTSLTHDDGTGTQVADTAFLTIDVFTNDFTDSTRPNFTYQVDCSDLTENQTKKWVKIWINQTARFIQFRISNNQAGCKISLQAIMMGIAPVGRLV